VALPASSYAVPLPILKGLCHKISDPLFFANNFTQSPFKISSLSGLCMLCLTRRFSLSLTRTKLFLPLGLCLDQQNVCLVHVREKETHTKLIRTMERDKIDRVGGLNLHLNHRLNLDFMSGLACHVFFSLAQYIEDID